MRNGRPLTSGEDHEAATRYAAGERAVTIATDLGVSTATIYRAIARAGGMIAAGRWRPRTHCLGWVILNSGWRPDESGIVMVYPTQEEARAVLASAQIDQAAIIAMLVRGPQ